MKRESQMVRSYWDGMCFMVPYYLIRSSLAHNVMGHMHGLLCEEEPEKPTTKRPSGSDGYCGCGEHRDEEMIECMSGKVCGGWFTSAVLESTSRISMRMIRINSFANGVEQQV